MDAKRINAIVSGRVHGVGFRYFVLRAADKLGVTGWVRNLSSGDVQVVAQGSAKVLEELLLQLRQGPRAAYVQNVSVEWEAPDPNLDSFELKLTSYY